MTEETKQEVNVPKGLIHALNKTLEKEENIDRLFDAAIRYGEKELGINERDRKKNKRKEAVAFRFTKYIIYVTAWLFLLWLMIRIVTRYV